MEIQSRVHAASRRLDQWFESCPAAAVAFSGGVDSALVAFWARRCLGRGRATAWIADSPSLKRHDLELARQFAAEHDLDLRILPTEELDNPDYARNPVNRCYFCKATLYGTLSLALRSLPGDIWMCSGVNLDDQQDYRPSMKAAAEAKIRHPLHECGIDKPTVRALAQHFGLRVWDKPASPCLSSRIPYGQPVTREKLAQIEAGEVWLQQHGFPICRVRHLGAHARIEVPAEQQETLLTMFDELRRAFRQIGFADAEIDAEGFASGKLNRAIGIATAGTHP